MYSTIHYTSTIALNSQVLETHKPGFGCGFVSKNIEPSPSMRTRDPESLKAEAGAAIDERENISPRSILRKPADFKTTFVIEPLRAPLISSFGSTSR